MIPLEQIGFAGIIQIEVKLPMAPLVLQRQSLPLRKMHQP